MILDKLVEERFFSEWKQRFEGNWEKYITPDDRRVKRWSREAEPEFGDGDDMAAAVQVYVYRNTDYKLSKKWKTPRETISSKIGDCEDFTFLISSMLPNMGVDSHEIHLGRIQFPDGTQDYHTWNEVDGSVADATGSREAIKRIKYKTDTKWTIEQTEK
jgi:transglutaminase-like putative cysteine protease